MAAAVQATRTYLRAVIGLGITPEGTARANAIIDEGLDNLEDLHELADDNGVKTLCANVRKPAGTIPQPGWVVPNPNPNNLQAPQIPRPGQTIPAMCEQRLALAAYAAKIYNAIGRPVNSNVLTRRRLTCFKSHKDMVENHNEPGSLPEIGKTFTVMKYLDQLPTHLREMLGVAQVPLAYVIRETVETPNPLPALVVDKPWSQGKTSVMDELISYFPHEGPAYEADNAQVFNLLAAALSGTSAMASITRHQRSRDGRQAYLDLVTHNLGSAKWEKTVEAAEQVLSSRVWNGKNSRYPLKVHIARHREAYNDLIRASHQITYVPPNETSRVRYLLTSIQTSDPTLCSAKTTIQADPTKKDDFEVASDFIMTVAPAPRPPQGRNHRIAALKSTRNNRGKVKIGPKTGVEIRFYRRHEWTKLSKEEQDEVREHRQEELKQQGTKRKANESESAKIAALETQLQEQAMKIAALTSTKEVGLPPKPKGNPLKPPAGFTQRGE